nr:MAG TPA: hypothetical protein [Caudoviricetes sp.]
MNKLSKMTAHELMLMTTADIARTRKEREEGRKQADIHVYENNARIRKRLRR